MPAPSVTSGASSDPNEIATYFAPSRPSVSIVATESTRRTFAVERSSFISTVTSPSGADGSVIRSTMPLWSPPTRTSAPSTSPATVLNVVFNR